MRKILEIRKDLNAAAEALKGVDKADKKACEEAVAKVEEFMRELEAAETAERAAQALAEDKFREEERKEKKRFSLLKFVNESMTNKLTGLEAKAAEEGAEEYRRLGFTRNGNVIPSFVMRDILGQSVTNDGDVLAETRPTIFMPQLQNKLTVANLGATVLTGLVGKVPVASSTAVTARWAAEGVDVPVQKIDWSKRMLSPKRNVTRTSVTKDLLASSA